MAAVSSGPVRAPRSRWDGNSTPLPSGSAWLGASLETPESLQGRQDGSDEDGCIHEDETSLLFQTLRWGETHLKRFLLHAACGPRWFSPPSTLSVADCSRHAAVQSGPMFKLG